MLLWEDFKLRNAHLFADDDRKVYDESFEEHWNALDKVDTSGDDWEDVPEDEDIISAKFDQFVKERNLEVEPDPRVKHLLNSDWEEVEE